MIGRCVQGIEAVILILNLWSIRHHKAQLTKALDDILGHLCERMKFTQTAATARGSEIRWLRGRGRSQLNTIPCGLKGSLEFALGGVNGFTGQRTLFLGERAHLFHQAGEPAMRAEPGALGAIQGGLIRGGIQFSKRLGF